MENISEIQKFKTRSNTSEIREIWRWDGYVSKGKQNNSTKAIFGPVKK